MAAGDIQTESVADPGFLVALAVLLGADIARGGQIGEHLIEVLRGLPFEARRLGFWPFLVLARASPLARRLSAIGRRRIPLIVVRLRLDRFLRAPPSRSRRARSRRRPLSERSISAACILSGNRPAQTPRRREKVASDGTCDVVPNRESTSDLSTSRRSIRAVVVGTPSTALATKALARARRSSGGGRRLGAVRNEGLEADHVEVVTSHPSASVIGSTSSRSQGQIALDAVPARFHSVERIVGHALRWFRTI